MNHLDGISIFKKRELKKKTPPYRIDVKLARMIVLMVMMFANLLLFMNFQVPVTTLIEYKTAGKS